jgi:hypothetical protein
VTVSVRPEDVELSEAPLQAASGDNLCKAVVTAKDFLGEHLDFQVKVGDVVLLSRAHPSLRTPVGDSIYLRLKAEKCVAIPTAGNAPVVVAAAPPPAAGLDAAKPVEGAPATDAASPPAAMSAAARAEPASQGAKPAEAAPAGTTNPEPAAPR